MENYRGYYHFPPSRPAQPRVQASVENGSGTANHVYFQQRAIHFHQALTVALQRQQQCRFPQRPPQETPSPGQQHPYRQQDKHSYRFHPDYSKLRSSGDRHPYNCDPLNSPPTLTSPPAPPPTTTPSEGKPMARNKLSMAEELRIHRDLIQLSLASRETFMDEQTFFGAKMVAMAMDPESEASLDVSFTEEKNLAKLKSKEGRENGRSTQLSDYRRIYEEVNSIRDANHRASAPDSPGIETMYRKSKAGIGNRKFF